MAATTNLNIILSQGDAVKELSNTRKQNLELNQQFVAQETEGKKKEDKVKVQKFEAADKVVIRKDEDKKDKNSHKGKRKGPSKRKAKGASDPSGGNLIDIRV